MVLFYDGWDSYTNILKKWTTTTVGFNETSGFGSFGRHGSSGYRFICGASPGTTHAIHRSFTPGDNTVVFGIALNSVTPFTSLRQGTDPDATTTSGTAPLLVVKNAGVNQCWVRINTDGTLSVYRGTTLLGTTTSGFTQAVFQYVEIILTIHDTAGVIKVFFNGSTTPALNLTSQNTRAGTLNAWNELRVGLFSAGASGSGVTIQVDDCYVNDGTGASPWNGQLGDVRADSVFMTGAGATTGWTPSVAPNWDTINENPSNGDTDYNQATAIGSKDTFLHQNAPVSGAAILAIQHCFDMEKLDAGVCAVAPVIRIGGVDYVGSDISPFTSYVYGLAIRQVSPATGVAFTEAEFNACQLGYQKTL